MRHYTQVHLRRARAGKDGAGIRWVPPFSLKSFLLLAFLLLLLVPARLVSAKTKMIPSKYGPVNVMDAISLEGEWRTVDGNNYFYKSNGKMLKKKWFSYNGLIYLVGKNGNQIKGWVNYRGDIYYLRKSGSLLTGWLKKTYFFRPDNGKMIMNGIKTINGYDYYFVDGKKQTGFRTINNKTYFFLSSGKMAKDRWVKVSGNYYRFGVDGVMLRDTWVTVADQKYYVNAAGERVTGTLEIGGKIYTFSSNGVLQENTSGIDPSKPMVALTFDDGPSIYTPRLLAALKQYGARATFFMVGDRVLTYASSVQQMVQLGCELGNHSLTHTAMTTLSTSAIQNEFSTTGSRIYQVSGQYPTVARLPYGDGYNVSYVLAAVGLPSIYWSIDTEDWKNNGNPQSTINAVLNNVKSGDIILMHDLYTSTIAAVETLIPTLQNMGYQLVTVSELARYKGGMTLTSGRTYFNFY